MNNSYYILIDIFGEPIVQIDANDEVMKFNTSKEAREWAVDNMQNFRIVKI